MPFFSVQVDSATLFCVLIFPSENYTQFLWQPVVYIRVEGFLLLAFKAMHLFSDTMCTALEMCPVVSIIFFSIYFTMLEMGPRTIQSKSTLNIGIHHQDHQSFLEFYFI